jgi:nucleolar protein 56
MEKGFLESFEMAKDFQELRKKLIAETKKKIKASVGKDNLIMQAVSSIDEADRAANMLAKRLREWYSFYLPEFSDSIASHEKFAELIIKKSKKELLSEIKLSADQSMGAELEKEDLDAIKELAKSLLELYKLREAQEKYLEKAMKSLCPNITAVAGSLIGAKLISLAGNLKKLSLFPASTVQLLGAEKALFRHLKTGAKSPKYGILHEHPLIAQAKKKDHGKIARLLADKIAIAAKVDFFKGNYVGDKLKKDIEKRLK